MKIVKGLTALSALFLATSVYAAAPNASMNTMLDGLKKEAGAAAFSAEEGRKLYNARRIHSQKKEERSCTTCHTANPGTPGKTTAGKVIEPISPVANQQRFTDPKKVEKWFKRNCEWVLERECTAKEKGDFITYMMSLK
ncbi:MAG: DUF1924 domain-containing protein [Deltaproteobacteria bacterium]|nr:DUF1924 domain-containing protein [Deltaproteobacteria bacterium]